MSPRGKIQNKQLREATLAKIQDASFNVFSAFGYNGTTMKQIAMEADLSYGLIYHYFPSKEAVFRNLVDVACEKSIETIAEGLNVDGSAWEKLEHLSGLFVKRALTNESSKYFLIIIQALTEGKSIPGLIKYVEERSQLHYKHVLPVIIQAQQEGKAFECDPVVLTAAYFSFIQGLAFLVFSDSGIEKQITPEILINVLRKGG